MALLVASVVFTSHVPRLPSIFNLQVEEQAMVVSANTEDIAQTIHILRMRSYTTFRQQLDRDVLNMCS